MSTPLDDMRAWLEGLIPAGYKGQAHQWVDTEALRATRAWVLFNNNGQIQGGLVFKPSFRLLLLGAQQDGDIQSLTDLAQKIITTPVRTDNFSSGCLSMIQPMSWIPPVGYTMEKRPFIELTFDTIANY